MQFNWQVTTEQPQKLRNFLRNQGISRSLLARIKYQDGAIYVNGRAETVGFNVVAPDQVSVVLPTEAVSDKLVPSDLPIEILYEDDHYLAINKPTGVASIPSHLHPIDTMANRVKGYLLRTGHQGTIHIITRLDRDTTGIMLFAKHGFAQSILVADKLNMVKLYTAIVNGLLTPEHDLIDLPIQRVPGSSMLREVGPNGKSARTEYWVQQSLRDETVVKIQLHTGRTHQIRVHFKALGHVLVGDDLYEGQYTAAMQRQGLHCTELRLLHPFLHEWITIYCPLPADMQQEIINQGGRP